MDYETTYKQVQTALTKAEASQATAAKSEGAQNTKAMRALKDELVRNKKLFESLEQIRKKYAAGKDTEGMPDNEVKKRIHQIETANEKYKQLRKFIDNPSAALVNTGDNELKNLNNQRRGTDGEFDYTRNMDDRQLLSSFKTRDQQFNQRMAKNMKGVDELKNETLNQQTEVKKQLNMVQKINERVDQTEVKMKKIDSRLEQFVATSSNRKLWCYIAA